MKLGTLSLITLVFLDFVKCTPPSCLLGCVNRYAHQCPNAHRDIICFQERTPVLIHCFASTCRAEDYEAARDHFLGVCAELENNVPITVPESPKPVPDRNKNGIPRKKTPKYGHFKAGGETISDLHEQVSSGIWKNQMNSTSSLAEIESSEIKLESSHLIANGTSTSQEPTRTENEQVEVAKIEPEKATLEDSFNVTHLEQVAVEVVAAEEDEETTVPAEKLSKGSGWTQDMSSKNAAHYRGSLEELKKDRVLHGDEDDDDEKDNRAVEIPKTKIFRNKGITSSATDEFLKKKGSKKPSNLRSEDTVANGSVEPGAEAHVEAHLSFKQKLLKNLKSQPAFTRKKTVNKMPTDQGFGGTRTRSYLRHQR